jgi:hypothetical protein
MKWTRTASPTGIPSYRSGGWTIEAQGRHSTHTGMVFGHYANDADARPFRVEGWMVTGPNGERTMARKLAVAKAAAERRASNPKERTP